MLEPLLISGSMQELLAVMTTPSLLLCLWRSLGPQAELSLIPVRPGCWGGSGFRLSGWDSQSWLGSVLVTDESRRKVHRTLVGHIELKWAFSTGEKTFQFSKEW